LDQTLESQTQTSRSQDRNRRRRFWCTRCNKRSWWLSARFFACRAARVWRQRRREKSREARSTNIHLHPTTPRRKFNALN